MKRRSELNNELRTVANLTYPPLKFIGNAFQTFNRICFYISLISCQTTFHHGLIDQVKASPVAGLANLESVVMADVSVQRLHVQAISKHALKQIPSKSVSVALS